MTGFNLNDAFFLDGVAIPGPGKTGSLAPETGTYATGAVNFDGMTFLDLAALAATDSAQLLFSVWFKSLVGSFPIIKIDYLDEENITVDSDLTFFAAEVPYVTDRITFGSDTVPAAGWHHLLVAMDVGFADGLRPHAIYLDDALVTDDDAVHSGGGAFTLIANTKSFNFMGDIDGDVNVSGDIADFWWGLDQYLDIGITGNRRKFISSTGKPVDLGDDGSTPTGTAPTFFLRRDPTTGTASDFKTDKTANGNDFTETGTLTDASTSPSD